MMRVLRGQVTGQRAEVCAPGGRQAGGVKRGNRMWVRRIAKDVGWTARGRVEDIRIDLSGILLLPGTELVPGGLPLFMLEFAICSWL